MVVERDGKSGAQGTRQRRPARLAKGRGSDSEPGAKSAGESFMTLPTGRERGRQDRRAGAQEQPRRPIEAEPALMRPGSFTDRADRQSMKLSGGKAGGARHCRHGARAIARAETAAEPAG